MVLAEADLNQERMLLDIREALLYATNYVDNPTELNSVYGLLRRLYARQDVFWHGEAGPDLLRP